MGPEYQQAEKRVLFRSGVAVAVVLAFTYIESGPPLERRYSTAAIGPLQAGPFIRQRELVVGQWGLTPDGSDTLKPISQRTGRPMSTNNARWGHGEPEASTFKGPWRRGQRCIIPVEDFDEPYWGTGKNIWWRFRRADGQPLAVAGLWNEWTDPLTGEVIPSYTMLTINCNAHPLLSLMHRPDLGPDQQPLPPHQQDKRTIVALEGQQWDQWGEPSAADASLGGRSRSGSRVIAPDHCCHVRDTYDSPAADPVAGAPHSHVETSHDRAHEAHWRARSRAPR